MTTNLKHIQLTRVNSRSNAQGFDAGDKLAIDILDAARQRVNPDPNVYTDDRPWNDPDENTYVTEEDDPAQQRRRTGTE